jgi:hypothetical protein
MSASRIDSDTPSIFVRVKSSVVALFVPLVLVAASCGGSDSSDSSAEPSESWCDVVADSNSLDDEFDDRTEGDSDGMKTLLQRVKALTPRFLAAAPEEIKTQVGEYAATNDTLVEIFADAGYDESQVDSAAFAAAIEGLDGAETDIDLYTLEARGVALGADDS